MLILEPMEAFEAVPGLQVMTEGRRDTAEAHHVPMEAVTLTGAHHGTNRETTGCLTAHEMIVDGETRMTAMTYVHAEHVAHREIPTSVAGKVVTILAAVLATAAAVRVRPYVVTDIARHLVAAVVPALVVPTETAESGLTDGFLDQIDGTAVRVTETGAEAIGPGTTKLASTGTADQTVTIHRSATMTIKIGTGTGTATSEGVPELLLRAAVGVVLVAKRRLLIQ